MKYPRECPAFEVTATNYFDDVKVGEVVEGCLDEDGDVCIYFPRGGDCLGALYLDNGRVVCSNAEIRPLTQAARDMLDAVLS